MTLGMNRIEKLAEAYVQELATRVLHESSNPDSHEYTLRDIERAYANAYSQALQDFENAAAVLKDTKPLLWLVDRLRGKQEPIMRVVED